VAHYNLARALQFTGRLEEAVPHFQAALRLGPELPDVREGLRQNAAVLASLARDAEASGERSRARILARAALALALECGDRALATEIRRGWPGLGG
jgi:tetratricopeptide (TPR) repeat protein